MPDDVAARMTIRVWVEDGQASVLESACRRALRVARCWPWVRVVLRAGHLRADEPGGRFVYVLREPAIIMALTEAGCDRLVAQEVQAAGGHSIAVRSGWLDWAYVRARLRYVRLAAATKGHLHA
jgi:hypothetical protein